MNNNDIKEKIQLSGKYFEAVGRRKRAIARVRLFKGKGNLYLNNVKIASPSDLIINPLVVVGLSDKFDMLVKTYGGGSKSQPEAVRLGIARALVKSDESLKPSLRKAGLLTRDPREKERKKPGLKRARRAPQWQKR